MPISRPMPLRLNPPKGASVKTLLAELTPITPVRIPFATRIARPRSRVQIEPDRP